MVPGTRGKRAELPEKLVSLESPASASQRVMDNTSQTRSGTGSGPAVPWAMPSWLKNQPAMTAMSE
ncbi:MAG: hypothetical protein LBT40_14870 [Deltaproteobacteria bacterium]|nr:hypothetical protein [Deltaproteobacteria bacterium]